MRQDVLRCQTDVSTLSSFARQLRERGFFVWPSLLDLKTIDAHIAAFEEFNLAVTAHLTDIGAPSDRLLLKRAAHDFHFSAEATQELIYNRYLSAFLRSYFSDEPVMRHPHTTLSPRRTGSHIDMLNQGLRVSPVSAELRIWGALEDIHIDSGPLYIFPGSHRVIDGLLASAVDSHPEFLSIVQAAIHSPNWPDFMQCFNPILSHFFREIGHYAEGAASKVVACLRKGDVLVFSIPNAVPLHYAPPYETSPESA